MAKKFGVFCTIVERLGRKKNLKNSKGAVRLFNTLEYGLPTFSHKQKKKNDEH